MSYNSKYTGAEVEQLLDQVAEGYATEEYVTEAIASAITTTLNTAV